MFSASPIHRVMLTAAVAGLALWAGPAVAQTPKPIKPPRQWNEQPNDGRTVSQGFDFNDKDHPAKANPDNRPTDEKGKMTPPTHVATPGCDFFPNAYGHRAWGVKGKNEGEIHVEVWNKQQEGIKLIWIQYDVYESGGKATASVRAVGGKPDKPGRREDVNKGNGWKTRTKGWYVVPQPSIEYINIKLKGSNTASEVYVDNLFVFTHCFLPGEKLYSVAYSFGDTTWPPEWRYALVHDWFEGTQWDRYGGYPPEWMAEVAGQEGVYGLPGGLAADGVLSVRCDDLAEAEGVKHVACEFDFYMAEGGSIIWEAETPPETVIENYREIILELGDGWQRCVMMFDVSPPPDWEEFRWLMATDEGSGPVAIDNLIISANTLTLRHWFEDFEYYENGSGMHGQFDWQGWDNDPAFDAPVTDVVAYEDQQAVEIAADADLVQPFQGCTSGQWTFTAWQYIPSDFAVDNGSPFDPGSYFLLLNTYQDGGPYHWSVQFRADANDGMMKVSYGDGNNTIDVPYLTDQWVEIRADIDLDSDLTRVYYDGQLLAEYNWTGGIGGGGGGALNIGAVDLFANGCTPVYYDNLCLAPDPDPELTVEVEQNGKTGKITARFVPGDKDSFRDPESSDSDVVEITSVTRSNVKVDGKDGGQMIVQFKRKKAGEATIEVSAHVGEFDYTEEVDINPKPGLFSVAVPGGTGIGEVYTNQLPSGHSAACTLTIIDVETGEPDPTVNGLARVALTDSDAFTFDGQVQYQEVEFIDGVAEVTVFAAGPAGELGYLEISDTDAPESVAGEVELCTDRISFSTDWSENFDAYALGGGMHGQGGWKGWDDNPAFDALVTDAQWLSDPHSVEVAGPSDLVREFRGVDSGQWLLSAWMYVPADFQSGCDDNDNCGSYFILLNTYNDGGPYHWSVQLHADSISGAFIREGLVPASAPLVSGQWAEASVLIDLEHDLYRVFYNGQELGVAEGWSDGVYGGGGGALNLGALDLYANGSSPVYWDDLLLTAYEPECVGDLDGDNDTDQSDLGILLADWGCAGGDCAGDLDDDGDTDQSDLGILLADWGCGP